MTQQAERSDFAEPTLEAMLSGASAQEISAYIDEMVRELEGLARSKSLDLIADLLRRTSREARAAAAGATPLIPR